MITFAYWEWQDKIKSNNCGHKSILFPLAQCSTNGGKVSNKKCIFPFIYNSLKYDACTKVDSSSYWCATEVDSAMVMVTDKSGTCDMTKCAAAKGLKEDWYQLIYFSINNFVIFNANSF